MNFQELLTRLSASCFAADRPDYDWKTLRLFPETGLSLVLIARLFAALVLCVIGALVHSDGAALCAFDFVRTHLWL